MLIFPSLAATKVFVSSGKEIVALLLLILCDKYYQHYQFRIMQKYLEDSLKSKYNTNISPRDTNKGLTELML